MGEMGQSINLKEVKVERVFRAVRDRATSSEQLANVREMRCLKGLAESQIVVELWRGEQGSLPVGMSRDWRALICFGSSGEVEEVGVEGVGEDFGDGEVEGPGAVGALVGEMVVGGWRETERVVEERWRRRRRRKMRRPRMNFCGGFDGAIFCAFLGRMSLRKL